MLSAHGATARPTTAIIGAGASGMLLATHLLELATARRTPMRAVLIDRNAPSGGVAYSSDDPNHRLNVTAARMSAFPDDIDHFVRWRTHHIGDEDPGAYAGRWEYRRYLDGILGAAQRGAFAGIGLARVVAGVAALDLSPTRVRVRFEGGGSLDAESAVLALGNAAPLTPTGCEDARHHPHYVNDPWAHGALERRIPSGESVVLLIGTGLTMVDVALTLATRHPSTELLAVSRSGLLPRAHLPGGISPQPHPLELAAHAGLPELVDTILALSAIGDVRWHQLVDDVRPRTQALWKRLTIEERVEFLATRHRAWCVSRHRMPPQVAAALAELIGTGRLAVCSGAVQLYPASEGVLHARISAASPRRIGLAVNCTGPGLDPRTNPDPLIRQLLHDGHARVHPVGIGFDTVADGGLVSRDGTPSSRLFTLGPPRMGELYESTAIPEIRLQAQALADTLVTRLGEGWMPTVRPAAAG